MNILLCAGLYAKSWGRDVVDSKSRKDRGSSQKDHESIILEYQTAPAVQNEKEEG